MRASPIRRPLIRFPGDPLVRLAAKWMVTAGMGVARRGVRDAEPRFLGDPLVRLAAKWMVAAGMGVTRRAARDAEPRFPGDPLVRLAAVWVVAAGCRVAGRAPSLVDRRQVPCDDRMSTQGYEPSAIDESDLVNGDRISGMDAS